MSLEPPALTDAKLTVANRVATLTLDRDDVRNELTGTHLAAEIAAVADWLNGNDDVSVLIVTGSGKSFSAGGNVKHMLSREGLFAGDVYELQNRYRRGIQRMAIAMHRLEIPSIAAINSAAIGAGFDLACMCDVRLAAKGALMGESFIKLGIIPGDGGGWFLQRLIGYQRAAELTFTGRLFDADEAVRLGIALEAVPGDALHDRALEMATAIAAQPPQALRLTKRLMKSAQRMELPDFLDQCAVFQGMCHNMADHTEAVSAFLEKRPPSFAGR